MSDESEDAITLEIKIGSSWRRWSGECYKVVGFTNQVNSKKYPLTVVYKNDDGEMWSRAFEGWDTKFGEVDVEDNNGS